MSDEEIARKVQGGEKEIYGEIVERYEKKLFGYIKGLTNRTDEEVEDLAQETLVSAYINVQGFDPKKKFSSWIYRIAHNKTIDFFKKKRGVKMDEDGWEMVGGREKMAEEIEIEREKKEEMGKAIGKLEVKYREVIMLYYFEEKDYEEISDILRIPTTNVGVLLYRAKKKLKEIYEKK